MPQATKVSVESNFIGGLKTEFTGLNFPENACTDTENCIFSLIGDVNRREGFDYETNYSQDTINRTGCAITNYKWNNAGGDGESQLIVRQVGSSLNFYKSSEATNSSPLSTQLLVATISLLQFLPAGSPNDPKALECNYSDGNGYLLVYHPYCDPFYCTYDLGAATVSSTAITLQERDLVGIPDGLAYSARPTTLTDEHLYNLQNQGWSKPQSWIANSSTVPSYSFSLVSPGYSWNIAQAAGSQTFTVQTGITGISGGQAVNITEVINVTVRNTAEPPAGHSYTVVISTTGSAASYNSGTGALVINSIAAASVNTPSNGLTVDFSTHTINSVSTTISTSSSINKIATWLADVGNYPANADIWFTYKDNTGVFNPTTTFGSVQQPSAQAPQGHFVLDVFNQDRNSPSLLSTLTTISTFIRPRTGAWFQGRAWYAGADDTFSATGDVPRTTWSEYIYFSQIVVTPDQFGNCFQENDPSDENLFDILPSDGGVIRIQGCGAVFRLFPISNGLLVFAANGIWFITGSQGIGFTATDFTITKISEVRSISGSSLVNVNGLPIFWNEEGIYSVEPSQQGTSLTVNPITVGTILSFYNEIPTDSKRYAKGSYNPIDYVVQWVYRSTQETDVTSRYEYDTILNLNTYNKAFYPYTFTGTPKINGVIYVASPGGTNAPDSSFKYIVSAPSASSYKFTFADEHNTSYKDWVSFDSTGVDYSSYFVTGYKLHGQALRQWQPEYVYMYSNNEVPTHYKIQGIWNYATSGNSGKYSSVQLINNTTLNFGVVARRHRIRGHGTSLQLKVSSVTGQPFDIIGWAIYEQINSAV